MAHQTHRRVVITGVGVVASKGVGKEAFWHATSRGISGIKSVQRFPTIDLPIQVAGEVRDFKVENYIDRKLANRTDRMTHFVLEAFHTRGPRYMSAYTAIAWLQVANVGQTSVRYGLQGYCKTPVNDTVGGLDATGMAYFAIRRGAADVLITGGCESLLNPFFLRILGRSDYCATGDDASAYRPFDQRATGILLAEGSAICILEEYEHALRRGAPIYGEIVGYGQSNDARGFGPVTQNGVQYARAMCLALQEAKLQPEDIGYFSLDGCANPLSDLAEVDALQRTFGTHLQHLPVSVPRTMSGHS